MTKPMVSVVMAARDAREWIGETLQSVCQQTYSPACLEVVVVDDGSADGTADVAQEILQRGEIRFEVHRIADSRGPSAARNEGLRRAVGEWIQFLDSDDLIDPEKVEIQAASAVEQGPDVAAVYSPWGCLQPAANGEWTKATAHVDPAVETDPILDVLKAGNFIHFGSQLVRKNWIERAGGFNESLRLVEDVELQVRMLMCGGRFQRVAMARPHFWYRQRRDSLSRSDDGEFMKACVRNLKLVEDFWRERNELTANRAEALVDLYFGPTRYFAEHDRVAFEQSWRRIRQLSPSAVPSHPRSLRWLSRLIGYPTAERVAVAFRAAKASVRPTSA